MTDITRQHETATEPADADDWDDEPLEPEELPRRSRRRLVTPAVAVLAAALVAALGFIGGVQVQKHKGGTSAGANGTGAAAGAGAGARAAFGARAGGQAAGGQGGGGGGGGATPTAGTVSSKSGRTLYVKNTAGTTVKVRLSPNATVTRNAKATASAVHPGDTVIVTGSTASSGTVVAQSVTATGSGVAAGGFFGGGGGPPAGAGGGARGGAPAGAGG